MSDLVVYKDYFRLVFPHFGTPPSHAFPQYNLQIPYAPRISYQKASIIHERVPHVLSYPYLKSTAISATNYPRSLRFIIRTSALIRSRNQRSADPNGARTPLDQF